MEQWLPKILETRDAASHEIIKEAIALASITNSEYLTPNGESCLAQGLAMGEILNNLNVDSSTLAAAIIFSAVKYTDLEYEDVQEHLGEKVAKLVKGTLQMDKINELYHAIVARGNYGHNIDNIRKMLIAIAEDIRIVLIKLAEELYILRRAINFQENQRKEIAQEIMAIYAPLANRLGMVIIKRELEDLAFQYLEPQKYEAILSALTQTKISREQYVNDFIAQIKKVLEENNIYDYKVSGRAKHIYSIYLKMQRKKVDFKDIYDTNAIRILVPSIDDCYHVLSCIHATFSHINKEFDDYINNPKPNGYRSIHTAVVGPQNINVEIQIRTYEMHQQSELGFAAHWIYKEGGTQQSKYEDKIAWLRQVMDWQHEITNDEKIIDEIRQIFNDRVYVFTPAGDILELPEGATPLDFAYTIHSDIGHRCIGAKINSKIVPLTYNLKTGDRIEILTSKNAKPSRDWLNASLGFLKTSRAKSKILHWYRKENFEKNIVLGQDILDKELRRLGITLQINMDLLVKKLNYKNKDEIFAALGSQELKLTTITSLLSQKTVATDIDKIVIPKFSKTHIAGDFHIHGIDNLLTRIANCCKPIPGDKILGYITKGNGVTIHREDCSNVLHALKTKPERILITSWSSDIAKKYSVDIVIRAIDRKGLVRDITTILADEGVMVVGLNLSIDKKNSIVSVYVTIEVESIPILTKVLAKITQLDDVLEARRLID